MKLEIVFTETDAQQKMPTDERGMARFVQQLKFVTIDRNTTIIGQPGNQHIELVPPNSPVPIGGGIIKHDPLKLDKPVEVRWDSFSLSQLHGTDKPSDPDEANAILQEIREAFLEWRERAMNLPKT